MSSSKKTIVLAFDSFKGCVSATEISQRLTNRIEKDFPSIQVKAFPLADGGEGTVSAIEKNSKCETIICKVHGPLMDYIQAKYIITEEKTAVIEMAQASGLPLIAKERQNPLYTTTFGTGELVADAIEKGCRNFILGLGGSATNDAATGMMKALGVRFFDKNMREVNPCGENLINIEHIDTSKIKEEIKECNFILACDVNNPFYGTNGAAYIFAPQKGAAPMQIKMLDDGLRHYSKIIQKEKGKDISTIPGSGAAGGMAGGIMAMLNAEIKSGIDIVIEKNGMINALKDASVIFTGEGKMDAQTLMGRTLTGVLKRANEMNVPVVAFTGSIEDYDILNKTGFTSIFPIQPAPVTIEKALQKEYALDNLERNAVQVIRLLF